MVGAANYGSVNNVKHGKMDFDLMNSALVIVSWDADFSELKTINGNLSTQLSNQED